MPPSCRCRSSTRSARRRNGGVPAWRGQFRPVVQLTTLPGWRQFVTAVSSIPNLLAVPEWLSLEDGKRSAHDEERLEHHSRLVVVQTPAVGRIVKRGGDLIRMNRVAHYGRSGLMVSGPPGPGRPPRSPS